MVLGDSFVFGVHLDERDTIPAVLERKLHDTDVYNLGIPGWGIDQMYLAYKKYNDVIKPQIVVLLYIDDDLPRIYEAFRKGEGMNKPSFSLQANQLVLRTQPSPESFWARYIFDKSIVANKLYSRYKDTEIRKLAKALFADLIVKTHENGQLFMVLRLPIFSDLSKSSQFDSWSLKNFFSERNCDYVELRDQMPVDKGLYIPNDAHFSAEGTAYVAEFMSEMDVFRRH
jgi:hypothetical protein